jgi:hypothetical protein
MEYIELLLKNLSAVFRHVIPGAVAISIAWLSHPSWFCPELLNSANNIWLLAVCALVTGNIIYVVHRNTVHQLIDVCSFWLLQCELPNCVSNYVEELSKMIRYHFGTSDSEHNYMHLRNSQILLTCMTSVLLLIASAWNECGSFARTNRWKFFVCGLVILVFAAIAHCLSFAIAQRLAKMEPRKPKPNA